MYHHYGIDKRLLDRKISGVYPHGVIGSGNRLTEGFDDEFYVPNSRFITWLRSDLDPAVERGVRIISENPDSGVYMASAFDDREIYITGHSEYAPLTLDFEYRRDTERGMNPSVPVNYYRDDSPEAGLWCAGGRTHAFCSPTGSAVSWLPAGLGAEPAAMPSSSRHTRSSGVGASMTSGCRDTGCVSSTRQAKQRNAPVGIAAPVAIFQIASDGASY